MVAKEVKMRSYLVRIMTIKVLSSVRKLEAVLAVILSSAVGLAGSRDVFSSKEINWSIMVCLK